MSKHYIVSTTEDEIKRMFYVSPYNVETYVMMGFSLLIEEESDVDVDNEFLLQLENDINNAIIKEYWAKKNGVSFPIQSFRIPSFVNRGYNIFTKKITLIDDPWSEIEKINISSDVE